MGGRDAGQGVEVFLEVGAKRVFAGAIAWPGWCRSGRDEQAALEALVAYAPRYNLAVRSARLGLELVRRTADFVVVERHKGDATTDYGAPGAELRVDRRPMGEGGLHRVKSLLGSIWAEVDRVIESAVGRDLRKGPRGGGRDLDGIREHIIESEGAYLAKVGWQAPRQPGDRSEALRASRAAVLAALDAAAVGEIASHGPRGGQRWNGWTFARRVAWHALDHAWEIEDRMT
jgi:hypothetical protein